MMSEQTELRFTAAGPGSIEDRYLDWKARAPERVAQIKAWLLARANSGQPRVSVALAFELMRDEGIGLNQSYRAPLVRELVREHPWLGAHIEQRARKRL